MVIAPQAVAESETMEMPKKKRTELAGADF